MHDRYWQAIVLVYHYTNRALWAFLITFVIYFIVFVAPNLPKIWASMERIRLEEIAAENALYCQKLKMKVGTPGFDQCLLTLGDFRVKVQKRIDEENSL